MRTVRPRTSGAARRVAVTFDDEDDRADPPTGDDPPPGAPPEPGPGPGDAGRHRRAWWVALPAAVVLVLVVAQAVADARERARVEAASRVPGVVRAVGDPARVVWRATPGTRLAEAARVGDVVVAPQVDDDHAVALVGVDAATGATLWRYEAVAARPVWGAQATVDPTPCTVVPDGAVPDRTGLALCLVTDGGEDVVDRVPVPVPATSARVVVVEAATGRVVAEHAAPLPSSAVVVVGTDVVLAGADAEGVHLRAHRVADGRGTWRTTVPTDGAVRDVRVTLLDPATLAVRHGRGVTVVAADGAVLRTVGVQAPSLRTGQSAAVLVAPAPALGAVAVGNRAGTTLATRLLDVRLEGSPLPVVADDGSVPGLVLTRTPRVRAWDARTGSPRWTTSVVDAQDVTVLQGRVHLGTASAVVTLDGATGEPLWRVRRPSVTGSPVTDGRHLYVLTGQDERHRSPYDVTALHLANGSEAWRVPAPPGVALSGPAGLLVVSGQDVVEVLG